MSVRGPMRKSAYDFKNIVWPKINQWVGSGKLIPVENVTEYEMAKLLDQTSGIDAWYVENNVGIRGIASRVQWRCNAKNPKMFPYETFTVRQQKYNRIPTEFRKLTNAIENDWLYPYWFVHAYMTEPRGKLMSVSCVKTKDLIKFITNNPELCPIRDNYVDAWFYAAKWDDIREKYDLNTFSEKTILKKSKLDDFSR